MANCARGDGRIRDPWWQVMFDLGWTPHTRWDDLTLTADETVAREGTDPSAAVHWARWRLCVEIAQIAYRRQGAAPWALFFESMDGDLYSLPVASPDCLVNPRYFGRLSFSATRIHSHDCDLVPGASAMAEGAIEGDYPTQAFSWAQHLNFNLGVLGLAAPDGYKHGACWHSRRVAVYPLMYETAVHIRTPSPESVYDASIMSVDAAQDPQLNRELIRVRYQPISKEPTQWLQIDGLPGRCWLGPRGHLLMPDHVEDLTRKELAGATPLDLAHHVHNLQLGG